MPAMGEERGKPAGRGTFLAGLLRLSDPRISLASFSSIFLGACAAGAAGPLSWTWLALTAAGIWAIETAKNASGEIVDWDSGTDRRIEPQDRSPFSGGKRVLVDGLLTRRQTAGIAAAGYAVGIAAGLAIAALREPAVLAFGVAGVALAFFYHAPPLSLSYRGLGEAAVGAAYGPLIGCGTYLVQRGTLSPRVVLLFAPLGLAIAAFLWINEVPDAAADEASGKRTLVVRFGRARAADGLAVLLAAAAASLAALPLAGWPREVWLGAVAAVPAVPAWRTLRAHPMETSRIIPAQARLLLAFVLLALGCGFGLLAAGN
jgi:1,4-dihydroxy-2-naphthoate octaprenyltransferase